jgi:hexosaminidase
MNILKKQIVFVLFSICSFFTIQAVDYRTIPLAKNIELKDGFTFTINENVRINVESKSKAQKRNAEFLQSFISEKLGLKLKIASGSKKEGVITLAIDTTISHSEGYKINIEKYKVTITGKTEAGVFYGIQTLCKSIPDTSGFVQLPPVEITDAPRFNYRGMHLDISRHFFSINFIKKYIDILALHQVNTFHWHLTDDQGWRIEIKKYPLLTKIGSKRNQTVVGNRKSGIYDSIPYGGFYTQKQIKEVVRYASDRYITVVPEIDMPGHMLAALAAYPQLGCTGGPYKVAETWGIFDDVLCPGNEKTFEFVENVLSEVIGLFPSKYIHIGGDECYKTKWKVCPKCQERIKSEGLNTDTLHLPENKLQSYFITRVEKFVNNKDRQIIGWDEILEGGLAPNAAVMSWRGVRGGIEAAKSGHKVIMTPNSHLYFDYYQSSERTTEPLAIGGFVPVENVYNYEPIPAELNETEGKYVIGAQANLWTEYITTEKQAEYMLLPRLAALSEVQWTKQEQKNYADFLVRLPNLTEIYKKRNYNFAKHVLNSTK